MAKKTKKDSIRLLVKTIHQAIEETKGMDTHVLDVRGLASFADYLIITGGTSTRQVASIANRIDEKVRKEWRKHPLGVEGAHVGHWVLMDYGDVVIHIFLEEYRNLYRLEDLWHNVKRVRF